MVKNHKCSNYDLSRNNNQRHSMNNEQIMNKNMQRLGGRGLSLNAFANAKTFNTYYNPSLIKKKKEFYRNAKFVKQYKKTVKQQEQHPDNVGTSMNQHEKQNDPAMDASFKEDGNEVGKVYNNNRRTKGTEKSNAFSLKARMERGALIQAKKEDKQKAEAGRKYLREKMFKKTRKGQPVMKYRIEHLLETIQSTN